MEIWKLSQVCDINPKKTVPLSPDTIITFIPMESVSTTGFVDYSQTISVSSIKSYSVFKNDDVLFAKITPCMENGKGAIVSNLLNGYGAGSTEFIVLRPHLEQITCEWLFYFLSQKAFRLQCQGNMTGSAGQKRVPAKYLSECTIPVPPLPEQQRIVARIEELFSQLDAGVETLKKTKHQLEVYRQAVLKEAFDSCETAENLGALCKHITDGDHQPPPKSEAGIPFVMISNIENNTINWNNTAFVGEEYYDNIDLKRRPKKGDVLYTVTGSFGIPICVDFDKKFCFQRHIALLRPNDHIDQKYLFYALQEPNVYLQAKQKATGTAQKTVGLGVLRTIKVPFTTSYEKQKRIVADIESKLSCCENITNTISESLLSTSCIRESILKQAFEGGL